MRKSFGSWVVAVSAVVVLGSATPALGVNGALAAPQTVQAKDSNQTSIDIAWTPVGSSAGNVRYRVYRSGVLRRTTSSQKLTLAALACDHKYAIGVAAADNAGHVSATTAIGAATMPCGGGLGVVLFAPMAIGPGAILRADVTGGARTVSFGYCRGTGACTWDATTLIGSTPRDTDIQIAWLILPPDGRYTLLAHVVDQRGRSDTSLPVVVSVDSTPPQTTIASGPADFVATTTAAFTLEASEPVQRFECNLDGAAFAPCSASFSLAGLSVGRHTLSARAVDLAGNVDPTPDVRAWTIDTAPPDTTITSGPPAVTADTAAAFTFAASEEATFECQLDGAAFAACSPSTTFTGLTSGPHRLAVRAIDRAGNVDPSPATFAWTITAAPLPVDTTITSAPSGAVASKTGVVSFTSNDGSATFECALDAGAFIPCTSPTTLTGLAEGAHVLLVRAVTIDGRRDETPATASWTVDTVAPTVTVTPSRAPDANGWYRSPVVFTTTGVDSGGALTCSPAQTYAGPDAAAATVAGSCTDPAGNIGSATGALRYDATGPSVDVVPSRPPDTNGWYNHAFSIALSGSDALSGGVTCTSPAPYAGPDTTAASIAGSCRDLAGNATDGAYAFRYDATAPTVSAAPDRAPDHDGAYTAPVTISFAGSDATSGGVVCDAAKVYNGPNTAAASVSGSCTDAAGNTGSASFSFKYEAATALLVTASPDRSPDHGGWYNAPVTVSFSAAGGGAVTCDRAVTYSGPDDANASVSGSCSDSGGNTVTASFGFKYDATGPTIAVSTGREPDHGGWFNRAVTIVTVGEDITSGIASCTLPQSYLAPDSSDAVGAGSCIDQAGNVSNAAVHFKYDATAPTTTAAASRPADANGWYRSPVDVSYSGSDATSGVESCSSPSSYAGPDTVGASLFGACVDHAGNAGIREFVVRYDATPPSAHAVADRSPDSNGWYNHGLLVSFAGEDTTSGAVSCDPAKTYGGPDATAAAVTGTCRDAAGNQADATLTFPFDATGPAVTLTPARPPDANGFYNHAVSFAITGTDAASGGVTCGGPVVYDGPDSSNATVTGDCTDAAGNVGHGSANLAFDSTSPETLLAETPPVLSSSSSATFTFSSSEPGSTFVCGLDGGAGTPCANPSTYTDLADGAHTFTVAAVDAAGNADQTPAQFAWTIDTAAPDTAFVSTPDAITNLAASFDISSPDATATFQCSLDAAPFAPCEAHVSLGTPADGSHTFRARAVNAAGNADPTPASYTWITDTQAPTVIYTAAPPTLANTTSALLTWTSNEPATFACRLDNAPTGCGTTTALGGTRTLTGLLEGAHSFSVRATDTAGNRTTVLSNWTVDLGPPDTDLQMPLPANPTASRSASFGFTATEAGSSFQCKLDSAAYSACNGGTATYSGLVDGSHTFSVFATDAAGNPDLTPATWTWSVDGTPPTGSITLPAAGAVVSGPNVTVAAQAADNVSILGVQFQLDGATLGPEDVSGPPYSVLWDTTVTSDGTHTLAAVIRDEVGNMTTTAPVQVTVSNGAPAQPPTTVDVGPGSVDASARQAIRTSAGRVYIIAADDTAAVDNAVHPSTGPGVIRAYKGNKDGVPTTFSEVDAANHPVSGGSANTALTGVDARLGSDGVVRTIFSDNSLGTALLFRPFSTVSDTWGTTEQIDDGLGTLGRGRITYALALDAVDVPHVVYVKAGTLYYVNRIGGVWGAPTPVASGTITHPMLALDPTGVLHLSWLNDSGAASTIMYAERAATGTWSTPEAVAPSDVLSNSNADQGPSIALDSSNQPYVLYVSASKGTFGPAGHTAQYGAIRIKKRIGGSWTFDNPTPDALSHAPQLYVHGNDLYAFNGHDTDLNFAYGYRLAGSTWSAEQKLTPLAADGAASIRWDPLHETDPSIIDATFFNEDRLGNGSFLGELYYTAVTPAAAP